MQGTARIFGKEFSSGGFRCGGTDISASGLATRRAIGNLFRVFETATTLRIWSLHPKYLDPRGLVALWREALLAQSVLKRLAAGAAPGGYSRHPQLARFLAQPTPVACIAEYLRGVQAEAHSRGYRFDTGKIAPEEAGCRIGVSLGQIEFERQHLLEKLERRAPEWRDSLASADCPEPHPIFDPIPGGIADWERL